jgi:hypothetical protein
VKSKRALLRVGLAITIVLADWYLFAGYIPAVVWHARHGNHVDMNGLRFRVPLLYEEDHSGRMNELSISTLGGPYKRKFGFITIDFHRQAPAEPDSQEGVARLASVGLRKSASVRLRLAGREGTCFTYVAITTGEDAPAPAQIMAGNISCTFGNDLGVSFNGTPNAVPDFYAIIASAENIKGKQ